MLCHKPCYVIITVCWFSLTSGTNCVCTEQNYIMLCLVLTVCARSKTILCCVHINLQYVHGVLFLELEQHNMSFSVVKSTDKSSVYVYTILAISSLYYILYCYTCIYIE